MQDGVAATEYHSSGCVIAPASRRLLRDGHEVEVEAKVFDLIVLLVGSHARALGKQEIIEALWGRRPITDAALSQLIYKARRACGDDGGQQQVIRTLHGRGLQWVAPVREIAVVPPAPPAPPAGVVPERGAQPRRSRRMPWLAAAVVALLALGGGLAWWLVPRGMAGSAPARPRIALLPIENATGDAALDWSVRGVPGLMASLLDQSGGIEVIDPLQVARAWEYQPTAGGSRAEHTRTVTHAALLVGGRLRKLADLYELTLSLDKGAGHASATVAVTGAEPGALAVAAMPRLRSALKLDVPALAPPGAMPADPFVAQTFARGMDAAMHGKWSDARPYFTVVASSDPGFLAGRYRLAQAQVRTGQPAVAQETLRLLLASATRRNTPDVAAQALKELAYVAQLRHEFADVVKLLEQARPFAERAGNPEIQAQIAISLAQAQASLKHVDAARQSLEAARTLIDRHALNQVRPTLYGAEIFIANGRNDFTALENAARASLAADEAIGDERGSATALFNIAYAMENQGRRVEALPLWSQASQWARRNQDDTLELWSGWYLASGLFNTGWDDRAAAINDQVLAASRRQHDASSESLALRLRAGLEWSRGDAAAALRTCREANALIDPENDPAALLEGWATEAFVALVAQPDRIADLAARADDLIGRQPDPAGYGFRRAVFDVLRTGAAGNRVAARSAIVSAFDAAQVALETTEARQVALGVALATGDPDLAAVALRGWDLPRANDAVLLRLASRWASSQGDADLARRVSERQKTLREGAVSTLDGISSDASALAQGTPGS